MCYKNTQKNINSCLHHVNECIWTHKSSMKYVPNKKKVPWAYHTKDDYNGSGTLATQLLFDLQGVYTFRHRLRLSLLLYNNFHKNMSKRGVYGEPNSKSEQYKFKVKQSFAANIIWTELFVLVRRKENIWGLFYHRFYAITFLNNLPTCLKIRIPNIQMLYFQW